jgi:5-amino-6-(5-phospho-D-ribitylamino)uracil phosphatase
MIKLLALDLDGTLLDSTGSIPNKNREAIRAAEEAGVLVTIATGRRFRDARPLGLALELNAPLVTHNGALLKYADSLETVSAKLLDRDTTQEIVRVGKEYGGDALVSTDPHGNGMLLYDRVSDNNVPLKKYLRWAENLHGGSVGREGVEHVSNLAEVIDNHEVVHISFSGGCEAMSAMLSFLNIELGNSVTILPTIYPELDFTLIDILPPGTTKGTGLAKLAETQGIGPENVMAIGDNFNDLGMLEFAGTSIVMGNADPKLLERAEFYKTDTNNAGGVAAAVNRFIFKQEK